MRGPERTSSRHIARSRRRSSAFRTLTTAVTNTSSSPVEERPEIYSFVGSTRGTMRRDRGANPVTHPHVRKTGGCRPPRSGPRCPLSQRRDPRLSVPRSRVWLLVPTLPKVSKPVTVSLVEIPDFGDGIPYRDPRYVTGPPDETPHRPVSVPTPRRDPTERVTMGVQARVRAHVGRTCARMCNCTYLT